MKKTYIKPSTEVFHMNTADGILSITSAGNPDDNFDGNVGGDTGSGEDFGREDNTPNRPNLWDQGW